MPKRKREIEEHDIATSIDDQALRIKVARLKARFDNGVQQLTVQLKLGRGFDRQKMSRRTKQAGNDQAKLKRLQAEIQILNDLTESKVAKNYLLKQCVRTKRIYEAEPFRVLFGDNVEEKLNKSRSIEEANVLGRLFKSNPVSEVMPTIMKGIREVLGLDKTAPGASMYGKSFQNLPLKGDSDDKMTVEDDFEGFSDEAKTEVADDNIDTIDAEMMQAYNSRIAEFTDDDDDSDSDSDENTEMKPPGQNHDRFLNDMDITTDEEFASDDENVSLASVSSSPSEQNGKPAQSKTSGTTKPPTFLPTLLHAGYYSGSESDEEPTSNHTSRYDPDKEFATTVKQRKNRRGQRERQAIAEKKFGAKAKHLLKARGAEGVHGDRVRLIANGISKANGGGSERSEGWDMRRGAVQSSPGAGGRGRGGSRGRGGRDVSTGSERTQNERSINTQRGGKQGANEKLHPSWEAARKKKMETANAGASAFAGKKITFD